MKRASQRHQLRLISEISVTPLLNLVLVLLLVFLLAVPLLKKEAALTLPDAPPVTATLAMAPDQSIKLNDAAVPHEALLAELKKLIASQPDTGVIVQLDGRLPVQNLVEVMAVLKAAGVRRTAVAAAEPKKS
jgi:biopolymer transport protein ExbD